MPGLISCDNSPLQSVALYLNASLKTYLANNQSRNDHKFVHLREMMEADLFLMDHQNLESDLLGFGKDGKMVCFKLQMNDKLFVTHFIETTLDALSDLSQEKAQALQEKLGFTCSDLKNAF